MTVQYTIPFEIRADFSAQALIPHEGLVLAQTWLAQPSDWPTTCLILSGAAASGKSHLAAIASEGPLENAVMWDLSLHPLTTSDAAVELFHLLNHINAHKQRLLILSPVHPTLIYPSLPDLDSRLKAASHVSLIEPKDDEARRAILFKICTDYQLRLDMDTLAYVCTRLPQTLAALRLFCIHAAETRMKAEISKVAARPLIEAVRQALGEVTDV